MAGKGRLFVFCGAAGFWLLLVGFFAFATSVTRSLDGVGRRADGIVVLTGKGRRIDEGIALLHRGLAGRLLISGVNPRIGRGELLRNRVSGARAVCCIDLGYDAQSTIGNATEAKAWAARYRFKRLIVVTASYHMPRSLAELALAMPDVELIAHPVVPGAFRDGAWWLKPGAMRLLMAEYLKLLPSYARLAAHRLLVRPIEAIASRPEDGEPATATL